MAVSLSALVGIWIFTGFIYQGQPLPPPNPALRMEYRFESETHNSLIYWRENESGFCERQAVYRWNPEQKTLYQKVSSLLPGSAPWCTEDLDMREGSETWTRAWIEGDVLHLALRLGEEELIYLWKKRAKP